jgi:hypothetical protein
MARVHGKTRIQFLLTTISPFFTASSRIFSPSSGGMRCMSTSFFTRAAAAILHSERMPRYFGSRTAPANRISRVHHKWVAHYVVANCDQSSPLRYFTPPLVFVSLAASAL